MASSDLHLPTVRPHGESLDYQYVAPDSVEMMRADLRSHKFVAADHAWYEPEIFPTPKQELAIREFGAHPGYDVDRAAWLAQTLLHNPDDGYNFGGSSHGVAVRTGEDETHSNSGSTTSNSREETEIERLLVATRESLKALEELQVELVDEALTSMLGYTEAERGYYPGFDQLDPNNILAQLASPTVNFRPCSSRFIKRVLEDFTKLYFCLDEQYGALNLLFPEKLRQATDSVLGEIKRLQNCPALFPTRIQKRIFDDYIARSSGFIQEAYDNRMETACYQEMIQTAALKRERDARSGGIREGRFRTDRLPWHMFLHNGGPGTDIGPAAPSYSPRWQVVPPAGMRLLYAWRTLTRKQRKDIKNEEQAPKRESYVGRARIRVEQSLEGGLRHMKLSVRDPGLRRNLKLPSGPTNDVVPLEALSQSLANDGRRIGLGVGKFLTVVYQHPPIDLVNREPEEVVDELW